MVSEACNIARNYNDVDDSWDSVVDIMNFYAQNQGNFIEQAKPGYFNDPDMVRLRRKVLGVVYNCDFFVWLI